MKTLFSYSRDSLAVRKGDLYLSSNIATFSDGYIERQLNLCYLDSEYFALIVEVVHVLYGTFRFDSSIVSDKRDALGKSCVFVVQDPCRNDLPKAPEKIFDFRECYRSGNSSDVQVCVL